MRVCKVEGHRGAPFLEVENTVAGFRAAYEAGADSVELDAFLIKDGSLVVFHGGDGGELSKLTHSKGLITELTLEETKKVRFDADNKNVVVGSEVAERGRIPSLEEVLEVVKEKEGRLVTIELKGDNTAEGCLNLVKKMGLLSVTLFSSFKHNEIERVKELEPTAQTAALFELEHTAEEFIKGANKVKANQIHARYDYLTKDIVDTCHEAGLKVMAWMRGPLTMKGMETLELYKGVMDLGLDTICVNHPEFFQGK